MSSPTPEQQEAISKLGKNIIVSAGAGSGKTFVLKQRVLREVTECTTVDKLIILTFTKNAAAEMKERIRKVISSNDSVKDQIELVDSAYITTFDSFSQSLVKKYNYLLNISKDFGIIDANIVNTEINNIIEDIFERMYGENNSDFIEMINKNCYKNDKDFKKAIINIYRTLVNISDRNKFLDEYIDKYYSKEKIDEIFKEIEDIVFNRVNNILGLLENLEPYTLSEKASNTNREFYENLSGCASLDDVSYCLENYTIAKAVKGYYDDGYKAIKNRISVNLDTIKDYTKYSKEEYIRQYMSTKTSVKVIIDILKELDTRIMKFKEEHNSYEFADIAEKAIELVKCHEDVRNEIKNNTYEIMIDEYQDTDDIQEEFISYIQNNNVYMVGDVKQSIYRFRNANPYIFKNKYDSYKNGIDGYKIDLTYNFRSREEVINNINDLFSIIMSDEVGGASYKEDHVMGHGNKQYDNLLIDNYDFNMELLNYDLEGTDYSSDEVEAFIMAKDIKKKMSENKLAVHEVNGKLVFEPISYKDFCVLVDKSNNFELIKKIFEYEGIPATIYKDVSIKEDDEVYILKNLISLIVHILDNNLDVDFRHAYMSIGRSYIYKISDDELFDIYIDNSFKDTVLYKKIEEISKLANSLSNKEILIKLIDEFDIINKLITVGDIKSRTTKLEYFVKQAESLNDFGYDIYALNDYFDTIINSDDDIKMGGKESNGNAVKIMTIHGSKGLEFNYVYSPYLNSEFKGRKHDKELLSNKYGFIVPYNFDDVIGDIITLKLNDYHELCENISEKIRLFYVAITRAKEKFIMVNQYNKKIDGCNKPNNEDILNAKSYSDLISLLKVFFDKYRIDINLEELNISKEYNNIKDYNYKNLIDKSNEIINIKNINLDNEIISNKHFSKSLNKLMDKEFKEKLEFGTYMHYVFEIFDFKNDNVDEIEFKDKEKDMIRNFMMHDEVKNIKNANIYKEYEIKYVKDNNSYHGFIDLLLEYPDHFDIIDYKLSNTDSEEYVVQLNGYRDFIKSKFNKDVNIYLYSIFKDKFTKLD